MVIVMVDVNHLIFDFNHRLNLLTNVFKDISAQEFGNSTKVTVFDVSLHKEILDLKKEMSNLMVESDVLVKLVFELGSSLKNRVRKSELATLKNKIDSWPLEDFISYNELSHNFNNYALNGNIISKK